MIDFVIRYRGWLAGLVLLVAIAGAPLLQKALVPNNALTVWFLEEDSLLVDYRRFQQAFGNDETIAVMVHRGEGWNNPEGHALLRNLTNRFENLEDIATVHSQVNAADMPVVSGTVVTVHDSPDSTVLSTGNTSPTPATRYLDSSGQYSMLYLQMDMMHDIDLKRDAIVASVREEAESVVGEGNAFLGGLGVVYAGLNEITKHDFGLFVGLSYLVMFIVIFWLFRSILLVMIALSGVFIATILTLELYGFLGYQVNMLTMTIPTIIIILAILDVLHIIHEYQISLGQAQGDRKQALRLSFKTVWLPCLFTTLTTIGGLISFVFSPMAVLREFGWFSSLGVALALVCSFLLSAAALPLARPKMQSLLEAPVFRSALTRFYDHQKLHRRIYAMGAVLAGLVMIAAMMRIKVDTYTIKYLPENHRVVVDHEKIRNVWGDYLGLEFTVCPVEGVSPGSRKLFHAMTEFGRLAEALPEVRGSIGLHTVASQWSKSDPRIENIVKQRDGWDIDQLSRIAPGYADSSGRILRMTLIGPMMSAKDLDGLLNRLSVISKSVFDGIAVVNPAGYPPLYTRIIDYITTSQIQSFYLALSIVFVMMTVLLRSLKFALISLVPNLFPILVLFGTMGAFGLTLDIATATTAAIVLGFSIDDTIHFMVQFQRHRASGMQTDAAMRDTLTHAGGAMIINSFILFIGYAVLLLASVKTVYYFGLLTMIAIVGGVISELILLPMLIRWFDKPSPKGI